MKNRRCQMLSKLNLQDENEIKRLTEAYEVWWKMPIEKVIMPCPSLGKKLIEYFKTRKSNRF